MARTQKALRLFVAAYPPPHVAAQMCALLEALDLPARRATPPQQVHLTLQFIGATPLRELDQAIESVERACSGLAAFELQPRRLIALPQRGSKRLIAMETDAPPRVLELHRRLVLRLARNARDDPADRYLPHFTLCRFRSPTKLRLDPGWADASGVEAFPIREVRIMKSVLKPGGAEHAEVAWFALGGP